MPWPARTPMLNEHGARIVPLRPDVPWPNPTGPTPIRRPLPTIRTPRPDGRALPRHNNGADLIPFSLAQKISPQSVFHRLRTALQPQFLRGVGPAGLHRLGTQMQLTGDLLCAPNGSASRIRARGGAARCHSDSQSVTTTEKGGRGDMMRASTATDATGICSLAPWVYF